jgi:protein-S-isoprenylcysteine O-methyltransferase Ste14
MLIACGKPGGAIMKGKKVLPPTYLWVAIAIMLVLHFLFPLTKIIPWPWNLLGIFPLSCGIALNLIADNTFRQAKTTVKPFEESTALVTSGVFRISRHPMYLGFVLCLIGIAVLPGPLMSSFVIPVFAVLMDRVFIQVEERMLEAEFDQAWLDYKAKVRRWDIVANRSPSRSLL